MGSTAATAASSANLSPISLTVINRSWLDINIYALHGSRRERLGVATASTTTRFTIPIGRVGSGASYQLLADPIGSRSTMRSETLYAHAGDEVIWTLQDDLARSTVEIR